MLERFNMPRGNLELPFQLQVRAASSGPLVSVFRERAGQLGAPTAAHHASELRKIRADE
jgi:hypothetical protein